MKNFIALALASAASAGYVDEAFLEHLARYGRRIGTLEEFNFRKNIFQIAHEKIEEHNASGSSFTLGHNRMSDWTEEEYSRLSGLIPEEERLPQFDMVAEDREFQGSTDEVDWRDYGYVTDVKDQGNCGSCWSFSTTGVLEGAHKRESGKLESFSEQQLVDCDSRDSGCNGGLQEYALTYLKSNNAFTEKDYPYTGRQGRCQYTSRGATDVGVKSYTMVRKNNVDQMKKALSEGPLAVSIDASGRKFMNYSGGIYDEECMLCRLDHAVLVVGHGSERGTPYWIMKNSWTEDWGEDGYMRVAIEEGHGILGIQKEPISAVSTN